MKIGAEATTAGGVPVDEWITGSVVGGVAVVRGRQSQRIREYGGIGGLVNVLRIAVTTVEDVLGGQELGAVVRAEDELVEHVVKEGRIQRHAHVPGYRGQVGQVLRFVL